MKEKILLPFEYTPELDTYHFIAFPLGIIQGNAQQSIIPWLSSQYINCWFSPNSSCIFSFFDVDNWAVDEKILFHHHINLHYEQFHAIIGSSQTSLLRRMLQLGYYPHGAYNEEFIPGKATYQNRYNAHDFIICGYDDSVESFISAGYLSDRKYQQFSIPYRCMDRAITTLRRNAIVYNFWKYNQEATFQLNCSKITAHMNDYLHSSNSQPLYRQGSTWGISAISDTGKFIVDLYEKEKKVDLRCTRAVMEFKKLMHMRISYLLSTGILHDQQYLDYSSNAYRLSRIGHFLGMKLRLKKDVNIAYNISHLYQRIVSLEQVYLPEVLSDLHHSM